MQVLLCVIIVLQLGLSMASQVFSGTPEGRFADTKPFWISQGTTSLPINTIPTTSADGLTLIFDSSYVNDGFGGQDLWLMTRASKNDSWGELTNMGVGVNSAAQELEPSLSSDGLTIYFERHLSAQQPSIWSATRNNLQENFGTASQLDLGTDVFDTREPNISADGKTLFFSGRDEEANERDIWMVERENPQAMWGQPISIGIGVNTSSNESHPAISSNAESLFFLRNGDVMIASRDSTSSFFSEALPVDVRSASPEQGLSISPDWPQYGSKIYFTILLPTDPLLAAEATWIPVPEPSTALLLSMGVIGSLSGVARSRRPRH